MGSAVRRAARRVVGRLARAILPAKTYRQAVFSRIYANHGWGGGEESFYSGDGSRGTPVDVYVDAVCRQIEALGLDSPTIVDLGCGDFTVGRELTRRLPSARYIGCDIVPDLVRHHQASNANERISFRVLDIVTDAIPAGDVHLVRQVFQHLSNADIAAALDKLSVSPCLIVTEGQPLVRLGAPNPDKRVGAHTRFDTETGVGAGVELDKPPFNRAVEELCRVELEGSEQIVTWRVK